MFANQAALAIENAIIHSNLETLNKDMRAMHEQLVQSEKMAALGAMIAEITHEIRNPLVSIGGFTRRLAKKLQSGEDKKYIDIILSEVNRLEGIIHDNLSYIKEVVPQPLSGGPEPGGAGHADAVRGRARPAPHQAREGTGRGPARRAASTSSR